MFGRSRYPCIFGSFASLDHRTFYLIFEKGEVLQPLLVLVLAHQIASPYLCPPRSRAHVTENSSRDVVSPTATYSSFINDARGRSSLEGSDKSLFYFLLFLFLISSCTLYSLLLPFSFLVASWLCYGRYVLGRLRPEGSYCFSAHNCCLIIPPPPVRGKPQQDF